MEEGEGMKIKEVEQRTGISSANIRFYEKEGLLSPERRKENNYRDYSEEDVRQLEQIKVLRMIGIAVGDIKAVYRKELQLEDVISERVSQLDEEEKHVKEMRKACENILIRHINLSMLDEEVLGGEKAVCKERLQKILAEDTTKVWLDKKSLNRHITGMLVWGYGISLLVTLLFGRFFLTEEPVAVMNFKSGGKSVDSNLICLCVFLFALVMLGITVRCASGIKVQAITLHLSAIMTPLLFIILSSVFFDRERQGEFQRFLVVFWSGMILYVLALWFLAEVWKKMFTRDRNAVGIALISAVLFTAISGVIVDEWILPAVMFTVFMVYVGLFWSVTNTDTDRYNRYYAIMSANRIINPTAIATSYRGKAASGFWR